ncbi:MAG: glycosyltransferase family 39 protein [Planctomycetaceae bacterium]|nr:glycosyltransferase family 39 protein [Planctomycetaceae bacterium]
MPSQVRQGMLLTVIAAVVFVTRLGATHLWDDDETFFAEVAREMHERDDLIVPWFNQKLFAHKPPFMYWMMIGAYRVFGVNEFAARFPSALFGLATVLLVWRLGRMLYSPRVGFWAAVVLATSLNFAVIARAATSDAELTFFCTLAIYFFVRGSALNQSSWRTFALAYASMGVAVLVKGPIGVLLPASVLGLFLLWRHGAAGGAIGGFGCPNGVDIFPPLRRGGREGRVTSTDPIRTDETDYSDAAVGAGRVGDSKDNSSGSATRTTSAMGRFVSGVVRPIVSPRRVLQTIWSMRPLTALAAVMLVAGPWYLAVGLKTHGEFLAGFFGVHHFGRFLNPMDNHPGPSWFYLAAMCVGFFPWIVFLAPTLIGCYRRIRDSHSWSSADILCGAWFVVWFGFFSLASTKFPHYVVPAYPALALVTAAFIDRWIARTDIYGRLARRGAWLTVGTVGIAIMVVMPIVEQVYLHEPGMAGLIGVPLIVAAVLGSYLTERGKVAEAVAVLAVTAGVFLVGLFAMAAVEIDRHQNSELIANVIRRHAGGDRPRIGHFHYYRPGLTFYCREPIEKHIRPEDAVAFFKGDPPRYLLTSTDEYPTLAPHLPPDTEILERLPWFLKEGKGIVVLGRRGAATGGRAPDPTASHDADRPR